MKKIRYIPYGYSVRNGHTVIEHTEAEVIRRIFANYINGASLNEIASLLTEEKIPYTEKTTQWDKARIARILENSRYAGTSEYDPIIDSVTYEEAMLVKTTRQHNRNVEESKAVSFIRNRVRCAECGSPMAHRAASSHKTRESWICTNDACGIKVRISDNDLLAKICIVMNRIILNSYLLIPKPKKKRADSYQVAMLQKEVDQEIMLEHPNEDRIVTLIGDMANQMYLENRSKDMIAARMLQKRAQSLRPSDEFDSSTFATLIETVIIKSDGTVYLKTKTDVIVKESGADNGGPENTQENGYAD